jgi:hypothetical protein
MKSRRPIYKGFKSLAELQININNETALVKLDVNKSKAFNNEFKKEKEDIFVIKSDPTSLDSLDSFANTNTGLTTLEESPAVYLQTSEFYQGKKDKNVTLLSSFHEKADIPDLNNAKRKPKKVLDYNKTKVGVDSVDQMSRQYSVSAATRRWPVSVFYNILNLAAINSWVLFKTINNSQIYRRGFIIQLVEEIKELNKLSNRPITPIIDKRMNENSSPFSVKKIKLSEVSTPTKYCQTKLCNRNRSKGACEKCLKSCCITCAFEIEERIKIICKNCKQNIS